MDWKMFFFGWLLKGQMNVSILDGVILVVELVGAILILAILDVIYSTLKAKLKKIFHKKEK